MPLRETHNARRYNERITLTWAQSVEDDYGHASISAPVDVLDVYAYVRQMSASKALMTFQMADVIGIEVELRAPAVQFNGLRYRGHDIHFAQPEDVDGRGRILRISGWYQTDR